MAENITDLIAEARDVGDKRRKMWPTPPVMSALIRRLADALEAERRQTDEAIQEALDSLRENEDPDTVVIDILSRALGRTNGSNA